MPAPVYNSRTGGVCELPAETIKAVDKFPLPAGFRREGTREASFIYSIGVYIEPIDEKTASCKYVGSANASCREQKTGIPCEGRDRANVNMSHFEQHTYQDKEKKRNILQPKEPVIIHNSLELYTSADAPGRYRIFSVHVPPVYVQLFMYQSASVCRYGDGGICRWCCRYTY